MKITIEKRIFLASRDHHLHRMMEPKTMEKKTYKNLKKKIVVKGRH